MINKQGKTGRCYLGTFPVRALAKDIEVQSKGRGAHEMWQVLGAHGQTVILRSLFKFRRVEMFKLW